MEKLERSYDPGAQLPRGEGKTSTELPQKGGVGAQSQSMVDVCMLALRDSLMGFREGWRMVWKGGLYSHPVDWGCGGNRVSPAQWELPSDH